MDGLLTAVKTVRIQAEDEKTPFLQPVATTGARGTGTEEPATVPAQNITRTQGRSPAGDLDAERVLQILKSSPDISEAQNALQWLLSAREPPKGINISQPGPLQAQLVHVLVTETIPELWTDCSTSEREVIERCLSNLAGVKALIARLRLLLSQSDQAHQLICLLEVLGDILDGDTFVLKSWEALQGTEFKADSRLIWMDYVSILTSGKIVATAAQARDAIAKDSTPFPKWLESGSLYTEWLGENTVRLALSPAPGAVTAAALMTTKALSLGYPMSLLQALVLGIWKHDAVSQPTNSTLSKLFVAIQPSSRARLLEQIVRWLTERLPAHHWPEDHPWGHVEQVAAVAALLNELTSRDERSPSSFEISLIEPPLAASTSIVVRRAVLACITARAVDNLEGLMERLIRVFGDPLFVKHAPITQQEAVAQNLLLVSRAVHSASPMTALLLTRSSAHLQGVSNRLESMSLRPRWLGMVVASAISSVVDKAGSQMEFGAEDMQSEEAMQYRQLIHTSDRVGGVEASLGELIAANESTKGSNALATTEIRSKPQGMPKIDGRPVFGPVPPPKLSSPQQSEIIGQRITEVTDEDGEQIDQLTPYSKPDSDPEDSDDDPTLIDRDRPRPPAYIRNLLSMLQETEKPNRFQVGLESAAKLIRQKTSFGKEVSDHAEELLGLLCNLQDPFDLPNFDVLRLQAMIATLLADVNTLAPWLCRRVFEGEYSYAQRCVMMSTLGLAGRELAGFKDEDVVLNPALSQSSDGKGHLGKKLPPRLHAIYSASATPSTQQLDTTSNKLEQTLLQPLALTAADRSTAHLNAVKIRTFSSRFSDTNRTRRKPVVNNLGRILASHFFGPLVSRYAQDVATYGSGSLFASVPVLLTTLIKTLAILLHASGPATAQLDGVTADFWDFLLSLRTAAAGDQSVMEATLFAVLTLLEVNAENARLVTSMHAARMAETRDWVQFVFDRVNQSGGRSLGVRGGEAGIGDEGRVQSLAAGILIKLHDMVEEVQGNIFGRA